jgi:mannose/fructose-specific phosphotransferase system component IIA
MNARVRLPPPTGVCRRSAGPLPAISEEVELRAFRIVLAGHGSLPAAQHATAELICGSIPDMVAVGLDPHETPDTYAEKMRAAIGHDGRRVLVLCDLLGGTPYNVASAIARRSPRVVAVAGTNLAMVVEAALATFTERLLELGRAGITETGRHRARRAS